VSAQNATAMAETFALLDRLKTEMPEQVEQAAVVGCWVWIEFHTPPLREVRDRLRKLGFHWNARRKCWQNPCGHPAKRSASDPRAVYRVTPAGGSEPVESQPGVKDKTVREYKVVALRECPLPEDLRMCDTPEKAAEYWRLHVATNPHFNPDCECFVVLLLTTRRRIKGHQIISVGTLDSTIVHAREVFRAAIIAATSAVVLMHNHPSGEVEPSEADVKITRDLIRAGQLLKIDVLDHVIIGHERQVSLRELGYFYA